MRTQFSKLALAAIFGFALTFTFSCSGDDGDEGGGGGSCSLETLDGVWEVEGNKVTFSGSTGTANGKQIYKELKSTGNLTWSGKEWIDEEGVISWSDISLTMSADGQKLTIVSLDPVLYGETLTLTRKCNNQSGGGSSSPSGGGSTYKDTRDGTTYKTTKIGNQTWLAENLNYNASGSICYGDGEMKTIGYDDDGNSILEPKYTPAEIQANCTKYGRLYYWETAKTACPSGWHLPSDADWDQLERFVNELRGDEFGKFDLMDWTELGGSKDKYGFSALPGGYGYFDFKLHFEGILQSCVLWSRSASDEGRSFLVYGSFSYGDSNEKPLRSVRCIKN